MHNYTLNRTDPLVWIVSLILDLIISSGDAGLCNLSVWRFIFTFYMKHKFVVQSVFIRIEEGWNLEPL